MQRRRPPRFVVLTWLQTKRMWVLLAIKNMNMLFTNLCNPPFQRYPLPTRHCQNICLEINLLVLPLWVSALLWNTHERQYIIIRILLSWPFYHQLTTYYNDIHFCYIFYIHTIHHLMLIIVSQWCPTWRISFLGHAICKWITAYSQFWSTKDNEKYVTDWPKFWTIQMYLFLIQKLLLFSWPAFSGGTLCRIS
jgi:hypothetical protein